MASLRSGPLKRLPASVGRGGAGLALILTLSSCGKGSEPLRVRTDLPQELRKLAEDSFEERNPGVDVRFTVRSVGETIEELGRGEDDPEFEVWWGAPADEAERALRAGRLQEWEPVMQTPFVIAFDRDVVAITDAPADWLDLLHHGWSEDVSLPDPGRSREGATFVTSVIAEKLRSEGDPVIGFDWLEQLDRQIGRYDADARESLRSMRMHRVSLAVVPRAVVEVGRVEWEGRLYYRAPESGSPSMVRAVAVVATASGEGSDMAQRFADHVQSPELLAATKLHTHWEPVGSWDERTLPEGFELRQAWSAYPSSVGLSVDSATVWIRRWSSDVRGRGK